MQQSISFRAWCRRLFTVGAECRIKKMLPETLSWYVFILLIYLPQKILVLYTHKDSFVSCCFTVDVCIYVQCLLITLKYVKLKHHQCCFIFRLCLQLWNGWWCWRNRAKYRIPTNSASMHRCLCNKKAKQILISTVWQ